MKSILFTIPNFITAGSGQVVLNVVKNLNKSKFSPAVCVLSKGGKKESELKDLGIPVLEAPFTVPARPYYSLPVLVWKAAQAFKGYHFDLWHSFHYLDDYTEPLIARLAGAKAWVYTKTQMSWGRRSWYLRTLFASRVVALNTCMMQEFFSSPVFRKKARHIPIGIDPGRFHPEIPKRLQLRRTFRLGPDTMAITCVAHLLPVKGQLGLIQAMTGVPGACLFLTGRPLDGEYVASLEKAVQSLKLSDRVVFLGAIEDIPALLAESDIFVLPSLNEGRKEGLPVALLEAMACGKACVATDIPGSRDAIQNGVNGLLVPAGETAAMSAALLSLAVSPHLRETLGAAARATVMERYTIEKEVAALESLYAEVLI
jgi:glycosyltransferase involved in cell wall biosynthesis